MKKNLILSIETSCDETSIAVIQNWTEVLSLEIATSIALHQKTKWIIPEEAARAQVDYLNPVFNDALKNAWKTIEEIDVIAVTKWPGLIWSLMAWITFANTLSFIYKKPLLWVNHIYWHIFWNLLERKAEDVKFPAIILTVSWWHNEIHLMKSFNEIELIWESLDDSAGEAFDKCWRMIWLWYPAWKDVWELAKKWDKKAFNFPRWMIWSWDFNFSFSGLKTSVLYKIQNSEKENISWKNDFLEENKNDLAASFQEAICDILVKKTLKAVEKFWAKQIHLAWWVSANLRLRELFWEKIKKQNVNLEILWPKKMVYCTDNWAMIWAAAYFQEIEGKNIVDVDMN